MKLAQDLFDRNYRMVRKEINEDLKMERHPVCVERLNVVKRSVNLKLIYRFNTTTIKILSGFFVGVDKLTVKFIWKGKELE